MHSLPPVGPNPQLLTTMAATARSNNYYYTQWQPWAQYGWLFPHIVSDLCYIQKVTLWLCFVKKLLSRGAKITLQNGKQERDSKRPLLCQFTASIRLIHVSMVYQMSSHTSSYTFSIPCLSDSKD